VAHTAGRIAHRLVHELVAAAKRPARVDASDLARFQDDKGGESGIGRVERGYSMMELQKQMRPGPATRAALLSRTF